MLPSDQLTGPFDVERSGHHTGLPAIFLSFREPAKFLVRGRLRCNREREEHENEQSCESHEKDGPKSAQCNPAVRFHRRCRRSKWLGCCAVADEIHGRRVVPQG